MFSNPQVATVGLTEQQAIEQGIPFRVGRRDYAGTAYGWAIVDETSFAKVLVDTETGLIIGAHILGPQAATLIQPIIQAMEFDQTRRGPRPARCSTSTRRSPKWSRTHCSTPSDLPGPGQVRVRCGWGAGRGEHVPWRHGCADAELGREPAVQSGGGPSAVDHRRRGADRAVPLHQPASG